MGCQSSPEPEKLPQGFQHPKHLKPQKRKKNRKAWRKANNGWLVHEMDDRATGSGDSAASGRAGNVEDFGAILSKEERRTILVSDPRTHGASEGE